MNPKIHIVMVIRDHSLVTGIENSNDPQLAISFFLSSQILLYCDYKTHTHVHVEYIEPIKLGV